MCKQLKTVQINGKVTSASIESLKKLLLQGDFSTTSEPSTKPHAPADTTPLDPQSSNLFLHDSAFAAWLKEVQDMPAQEQIQAVSRKLVNVNPGFDGKLTAVERMLPPAVENGVVHQMFCFARECGPPAMPIKPKK